MTVNRSGTAVGYDDYYPFGKRMPGRSLNTSNPHDAYKFTGKELDQEDNIDLAYFGARYYDPEIGRWMSVDPKAQKYPQWNPYNYGLDNPVRFVDPNGLQIGGNGSCCSFYPTSYHDFFGYMNHYINNIKYKVNSFNKTMLVGTKVTSQEIQKGTPYLFAMGLAYGIGGAYLTYQGDLEGGPLMIERGAIMLRYSVSINTYATDVSAASQFTYSEVSGGPKKLAYQQVRKAIANEAVSLLLDKFVPISDISDVTSAMNSTVKDVTNVSITQQIDNMIRWKKKNKIPR